MKIALAQINPVLGDLTGNVDAIASCAMTAASEGADLVVFPELAISGYPPEDLLLRSDFLRDCSKALEALAGKVSEIPILVGFPEVQGADVYNAAAFIEDGKIKSVYRKSELPNYGVFDEERYFESGSEYLIIDVAGKRLFVTICEDIWVTGGKVSECVKELNPDAVINLSASPFHAGKLDMRREVLSSFASDCDVDVCYVNVVGGQDELVFDGGSMTVTSQGEVTSSAKRFKENILYAELPLETHLDHENLNPHGEVYEALVLGTRDYCRKTGFSNVLIGLSGGIDSALVAAVAVEALGPENVTGVTMPSKYTSDETFSDAEQLALNLGINLITKPIKNIYESYSDDLAPELGSSGEGIAFENIQARIRGNILMALSNKEGSLVLTTGNKSEMAVGYCTLYGDMAGGYAVIKDVPKTLVFSLSRYVNERGSREIIPVSTIERPPSAELRPDQKDTDSLPPYDVLDKILELYVECDTPLAEILAHGFDEGLVDSIIRKVDINEYKRRQAPPGVKITPRAFGRDRRLPISNRYRNRF